MKRKYYFKWLVILFSIQILSGCYHLYWTTSIDENVGQNIYNSKIDVTGGRNFEKAKKDGLLYKETQEPPNTRYFFNWSKRCHYSLLVSPDGTILSWAFSDYKKRKECYVH